MDYEFRVIGFMNILKEVADIAGVKEAFGNTHLVGKTNEYDEYGVKIYDTNRIGLKVNVVFKSRNEGRTETVHIKDENEQLIIGYSSPMGELNDRDVAIKVTEAYLKRKLEDIKEK